MKPIKREEMSNATFGAYVEQNQGYVYRFTEFDGEELNLTIPAIEMSLKTGEIGSEHVLLQMSGLDALEMLTSHFDGEPSEEAVHYLEMMRDYIQEAIWSIEGELEDKVGGDDGVMEW